MRENGQIPGVNEPVDKFEMKKKSCSGENIFVISDLYNINLERRSEQIT